MTKPCFEGYCIPEVEIRNLALSAQIQEPPRRKPSFSFEYGMLQQFGRLLAPAAAEPGTQGNLEPALSSTCYAITDPAPRHLPEDRIEPSALQPDLIGKSSRKFPEPVIQKWRAGLQPEIHR